MLSEFEKRVASTAVKEYDVYHLHSESDPELGQEIERYWGELGIRFPGAQVPWSAVSVSWCLKAAGATADEFKFSQQHSVFVRWAIDNMQAQRGLFRAHPIVECAPSVGDIIQNNRDGNIFDFGYAAAHSSYPSHSAIVVATGHDHTGPFAVTIGGNESDSIRRTQVTLDDRGYILQRQQSPYICVIQTLK